MKNTILFLLGFVCSTSLSSIMKRSPNPQLCESLSCIQTAITILNNVDSFVDPCENFYKFACGNFVKNTIIPDDKSSISTYSLTRKLVLNQLYALFQVDRPKDDLVIFKRVMDFYNLCMNLDDLEKREEYPGWSIFKLLGKWPVLEENWDDKDYVWQNQVFLMKKNGLTSNFIVDVSISRDQKNDTRFALAIDQPSLGINKEYWLKEEHVVVKGYYEYMIDIVTLFLRGKTNEQVRKDMTDVFNFEKKLSEISMRKVERRDPTKVYNPMSIKVLQEKYPYLNWLDYINNLYNPHLTIKEDEIVIVAVPSFLEKLGPLLNSTPARTISNYLNWRVAKSIVGFMPKQFRDRGLLFGSLFSGKTIRSPRWEECIDSTSSAFNLAVGSMYVRKYFDPDSKHEMMDIINNLRDIFTHTLENVDWMTSQVRKEALKKMAAITNHVAYPDELLDDNKLEDYYKQFQPKDNIGYLEYNLELNKFFLRIRCEKFRQPINKTDWTTHGSASVVNAFYSPIDNSIQFPAGVLQGMFFHKDRPRYLNYGSIGFTVGHEITHGFDDRGRQFNKRGLLVNWWDNSTGQKFVEKAKCIIDQYSAVEVILTNKYSPEDKQQNVKLHLNGINTQGENIADNGGLKHAYMAYRKWSNGKIEPRLPGLGNYTQNQLFWISAANKWCSVYKPQILENMILNDPHSPGEYRINIPMSNIKEFSNDWQCPENAPMNPTHKCIVW